MTDPVLPASPERKSRSGCLIALYVMLGLALLLFLAGGVGTWLFLRSERGQKVIEVVKDGVALAREAARAPGTDELRAAGCNQAMVMASARIFDLVGELGPRPPDGEADKTRRENQTYVLCQFNAAEGDGPACSEIVKVYAKAVADPPQRIGVMVQNQRRGTGCRGVYAPDGSFIEPLDRRDRRIDPDQPQQPEILERPDRPERSERSERPESISGR